MKKRLLQDDKIELFSQIKEMTHNGTIRTKDIAKSIHRTERQTRRYLAEMSKLGARSKVLTYHS